MTRQERNLCQFNDIQSDRTLIAFYLEFGRKPDDRRELWMFYVDSGMAEKFAKTHPMSEVTDEPKQTPP